MASPELHTGNGSPKHPDDWTTGPLPEFLKQQKTGTVPAKTASARDLRSLLTGAIQHYVGDRTGVCEKGGDVSTTLKKVDAKIAQAALGREQRERALEHLKAVSLGVATFREELVACLAGHGLSGAQVASNTLKLWRKWGMYQKAA